MGLMLLLLGPIAWGIVGLVRGRMPISGNRELRPPHVVRYAWTLILTPVIFSALALGTYFLATGLFKCSAEDVARVLMFSVFALLLVLAFTLSKAKKHSVPSSSYASDQAIDFNSDEIRQSAPDFSNIED